MPVFAFAEDVAASGGYWLALAADEIYAEETSLVGSIGVVSAASASPQVLAGSASSAGSTPPARTSRCSIRSCPRSRAMSSGSATLQRDLHESFKALVRARRGAKLKGDDATLFSGEVFTGRRALALGLIDGIGESRGVLRARFGDDVRLRPIEPERRRFALLPCAWPRRPMSPISPPISPRWLEERLIWARFGLSRP